MDQDRYPFTYRAAEVQQVMDWIKAGQSGCIIALRGGGKSNILRFLLLEETRHHYLGQDYTNFAFFLIDLLALTECTEWAVCELILDRLLDRLCSLETDDQIIEEMTLLQQEVIRTRDLLTAYRALERCVDILCQQPNRHIVLLFSEFDAVFRTLDPSLFRCLRAVRDAYKGQVSYIVVVANDLVYLRDDLAAVDPFYRLVSRNTCYLGPFSETDARHMIQYLAAQRSAEISAEDRERLIQLSGGHAGTIKAILSLLWSVRQECNMEEIAPTLNDDPTVQAECRKAWESLSNGEQAALYALTSGAQVAPPMLQHLQRRGVVRENQPANPVFSPLLADFIRQQLPPSPTGTVISRSPPIVQIDGERITTLTELEFELLCYLYEHRGQVCTKDELVLNVYRQQYDRMAGGVTDEALQTLASRLRDKIEPDRKRPRYVVTIRGEGYKFIEPPQG